MRTFNSTADWVTSALMDLEPSVFDSRLNSCIMKSRRRPQAPPFFMIFVGFADVHLQAIQLFGHVDLLGQQHDLLLDAGRIQLHLWLRPAGR